MLSQVDKVHEKVTKSLTNELKFGVLCVVIV